MDKEFLDQLCEIPETQQREIAVPVVENERVLQQFILEVIDEPNLGLEKKVEILGVVAEVIAQESLAHRMKEPELFKPSPFANSFTSYIYSWGRLAWLGVPFHEWEDFAKEGVDLLKAFVKEKQMANYETDPRFTSFAKGYYERFEHLRVNKGYTQLDELIGI